MNTIATAAMTAKVAAMTTEQLIDASLALSADCSSEAIAACAYVERELESRLPEREFIAHMAYCEGLLEIAA